MELGGSGGSLAGSLACGFPVARLVIMFRRPVLVAAVFGVGRGDHPDGVAFAELVGGRVDDGAVGVDVPDVIADGPSVGGGVEAGVGGPAERVSENLGDEPALAWLAVADQLDDVGDLGALGAG